MTCVKKNSLPLQTGKPASFTVFVGVRIHGLNAEDGIRDKVNFRYFSKGSKKCLGSAFINQIFQISICFLKIL
jgi:hypothetical protein